MFVTVIVKKESRTTISKIYDFQYITYICRLTMKAGGCEIGKWVWDRQVVSWYINQEKQVVDELV